MKKRPILFILNTHQQQSTELSSHRHEASLKNPSKMDVYYVKMIWNLTPNVLFIANRVKQKSK